jgi:DNA-binding transcriptional MerR regulator
MRSAGIPIEALIEYFGLIRQGDSSVEARKELLTEQRKLLVARMKTMQESLDRLNYKIESYEKTVALKEKELAKDKK